MLEMGVAEASGGFSSFIFSVKSGARNDKSFERKFEEAHDKKAIESFKGPIGKYAGSRWTTTLLR